MSLLSNVLLASSMSADAFAASVCKGVGMQRPRLIEALRIGALFGIIEAFIAFVGWGIGGVASSLVASASHWIAFFILTAIGCKMIYESLHGDEEACRVSKGLHMFVLTAIGTSIDSLAVGVTIALMGLPVAMMVAMIGAATFVMATIGIMAGHYLGMKAGAIAEVAGGVVLIAIGVFILVG